MKTLKNIIAGVIKEEDATQLVCKTLLHLSNKSPGWAIESVWTGIQMNGATVETKIRLAIAAQRAGRPRLLDELALEAIRTGRRRNVRNDLEEVDSDRRYLLASIHERLGRKNLPERLRQQL